MADHKLDIPRLDCQPPTVDFIHHRLPKYHPAFENSAVHYDPKSRKFEPNSQIKVGEPVSSNLVSANVVSMTRSTVLTGLQPISQDTTLPLSTLDTSDHAERILFDALSKFNTTTPEPKHLSNSEYSIRKEKTWSTIHSKLEKARDKYQSNGGKAAEMVKKTADHIAPVVAVGKTVARCIPENPYSTPMFGVVELIANAVKVSTDVRDQVLKACGDLDKLFKDVGLFLAAFPGDGGIHKASTDLTVAVLHAIEQAISFFIGNKLRKGATALMGSSSYKAELQESLISIREKSERLAQDALKLHMFEAREFQRQQVQVERKQADTMNNMLDLMSEHAKRVDRKLESIVEYEKQRHRQNSIQEERLQKELREFQHRIENAVLHSPSTSPQIIWVLPQPAAEWHLSQNQLRAILNSSDIDLTDMEFISDKKGEFPARELGQAEQIVTSHLFRNWLTSPHSTKLLIHWDRQRPKTIADTSPLSVFCVSISKMLQTHSRFLPIAWFCGRHSDPAHGDGGHTMIASLIDQLLRQYDFDTRHLGPDNIDFERLTYHDPLELLRLLDWLVRQLPITITLVILIDSIFIYERSEFATEALPVLSGLLSLVSDQTIHSAIKLLFTSTIGTHIVRQAFEQEDLILNVDALAQPGLVHSEERMARELSMV